MVGIRIDKVSKRFGTTVAVDDVSLDIAAGDLFFLLGPSGCGKTTLLRLIAGFETPTGGDIRLGGRSIREVPPHKRNTALVFQNYALWPHMTVYRNVAYGLDERRVPKQEKAARVEAALARVHMASYAQRMANQLSGGQQQRIALARALVVQPDVVLLDEPLSNLDARLRLQMRHEIRRIHDETGITMVYVTHDQKESLSMADRIAVMSMGRIEQIGSPRQVYRTPANRFVADFMGETNIFPGTLAAVEGDRGRVKTALGEFTGRLGTTAFAVGDAVCCMVRPECLLLGGPAREHGFAATVTKNLYLGEVEQFELAAGDCAVRAVLANPGERAPRPGASLHVSFAPDDAIILGDA